MPLSARVLASSLALSFVVALQLAGAVLAPLQEQPVPAPAVAPLPGAPKGTAPAPAAPAAPSPGAAADDAAADAAGSRARGEAALDRAATFQRGAVPRSSPRSLHGRFFVGVRDNEGSLIKSNVERWFTTEPARLLDIYKEAVTGAGRSVGWDGTVGWFRDTASGHVEIYSDDPVAHEVDLDQLQEQLRLTRLLLQASVLDALRPRLSDVKAEGTAERTDLDGGRHAVELVTARLPDELYGAAPADASSPPPAFGAAPTAAPEAGAGLLELRFAVDRDTGALWELRVLALGRSDVEPLTLHFDFHGATASGLRVPGNIRVFKGDHKQPFLTLGVHEKDGSETRELLFDVDTPVADGLFERPKP
jgi:hypothetical protein